MSDNVSEFVSPEAGVFLSIMLEEIRLPEHWETSGLWLSEAQALAQFIADHRGRIPLRDATMLVGIGGLLIEMSKREREASAETGRWLRGED